MANNGSIPFASPSNLWEVSCGSTVVVEPQAKTLADFVAIFVNRKS
jgi:hypothetical protein